MTSLVISRHFAHSRRLGMFAVISAAFATWRQRRALARLDGTALNDLGLSAAEVAAEIARPIWDVPQNWRS